MADEKIKGVVGEVGLARDEDKFNAYNITIGLIVKSERSLTYAQGERLIKQYQRDLLGKEIEIASIIHPCPVCGKGFNTAQGMKQHVRMVHEKKKKAKQPPKKTVAKKKKSTRKKGGKKTT